MDITSHRLSIEYGTTSSIVISLILPASVKEYQGGMYLNILSQFFFFTLLGANSSFPKLTRNTNSLVSLSYF